MFSTINLLTTSLAGAVKEQAVRRGELYRVFRPRSDTKQHRIFAVVSRQALIESRFSTVICAPVFSHGAALSSQVVVGPEEGLKHVSWITCDNLVSLPKSELTNYIGMLPPIKMRQLDEALKMALDLR